MMAVDLLRCRWHPRQIKSACNHEFSAECSGSYRTTVDTREYRLDYSRLSGVFHSPGKNKCEPFIPGIGVHHLALKF